MSSHACLFLAGTTGFGSCTSCPAGKWKAVSGNFPCQNCPLNTNSAPATTSITGCTCLVGFTVRARCLPGPPASFSYSMFSLQ